MSNKVEEDDALRAMQLINYAYYNEANVKEKPKRRKDKEDSDSDSDNDDGSRKDTPAKPSQWLTCACRV